MSFFFRFAAPRHCHRHPLLPLNSRDRGPICQRLHLRLFTSIFTSKWLARRRSSPNGALPLAAKTLLCFICTNRSAERSGADMDNVHFTSLPFFSFYYCDTCLILALLYTCFLFIPHSTSSLACFVPSASLFHSPHDHLIIYDIL